MPRTRVGAVLLPYSVTYERVLAAARRAEDLGFDSVWVPDHLQRGSMSLLECWTTISALAASTTKVRLGSLATCNTFRNPGLLAKMIATASQISKGRVDVGIGVGYDDVEHTAYGYLFPKLRERVAALGESLKVMKMLWGGGRVDFEGKHYSLRHAVSLPAPVRDPRVWVAGRSDAVLQAAAASGAYGVNVLPYSGTRDERRISTPEELANISGRIRSIKRLKSSIYCGDGGAVIGRTGKEFSHQVAKAAKLAGCSRSGMSARLANLSALYGTVEQCERKKEELESAGFEELMLIFPGWQRGDYSNMDSFAEILLH